jgi:glycosyltransferase involved in cell wall biosynthesis
MARMLGKPVIASDNPVVRMHIPASGQGGSLVPIGDAAALRAELERLIRSSAERQRLGADARAGAVADLSLDRFVERMLAASDVATARTAASAPRLPARRQRVLVLCPIVTDTLYGATFFSLARALAARGARVDAVSPWAVHRDIDPTFPERQPLHAPDAENLVARFADEAAFDEYDLIVTPDIPTGHRLLRRGTPPIGKRLAITDFHLLWGMDDLVRERCAPGQRPKAGGWWPSERVFVYSAFRGYAWLYENYGVPMNQVVWQPYALDPASFPPACPAHEGETILSAGRHLRDIDTLLAAAARLDDTVHPIDLFAEGELTSAPRRVRFRRTVPSSIFCPEVGRSRFMVVPLVNDPHNAAGITAMATATIYGRPIIATATAAARDYVTEDVNGMLVPPGDVAALAAAIRRLDTDHALLTRLAAGARERTTELSTDTWARSLLTDTGDVS